MQPCTGTSPLGQPRRAQPALKENLDLLTLLLLHVHCVTASIHPSIQTVYPVVLLAGTQALGTSSVCTACRTTVRRFPALRSASSPPPPATRRASAASRTAPAGGRYDTCGRVDTCQFPAGVTGNATTRAAPARKLRHRCYMTSLAKHPVLTLNLLCATPAIPPYRWTVQESSDTKYCPICKYSFSPPPAPPSPKPSPPSPRKPPSPRPPRPSPNPPRPRSPPRPPRNPPSPRPSPPPSSPPPPCSVCATVTVIPPGSIPNPPPFFSPETCADVSQFAVDALNAATDEAGASMAQPFSATSCSDFTVTVCGVFSSSNEAAKLSDELIQTVLESIAKYVSEGSCTPQVGIPRLPLQPECMV